MRALVLTRLEYQSFESFNFHLFAIAFSSPPRERGLGFEGNLAEETADIQNAEWKANYEHFQTFDEQEPQ